MEKFFLDLVQQLSGMPGYVLLGSCAFIENLVPPLPGDTVTVFGGYLAATGRLSVGGAIVATTLGSWAGFLCLLWAGRVLGKEFFLARSRLFRRDYFLRAEAWFQRFGYSVVLVNRFLPGARSVISVCAGIAGLHAGWTALWSLVSCFVWNSLLIAAGYLVGENWAAVVELLRRYNIVVLSCAGAAVLFVIAKKMIARAAK